MTRFGDHGYLLACVVIAVGAALFRVAERLPGWWRNRHHHVSHRRLRADTSRDHASRAARTASVGSVDVEAKPAPGTLPNASLGAGPHHSGPLTVALDSTGTSRAVVDGSHPGNTQTVAADSRRAPSRDGLGPQQPVTVKPPDWAVAGSQLPARAQLGRETPGPDTGGWVDVTAPDSDVHLARSAAR